MKATEKQKLYMLEYYKKNKLKINERRRKHYQESARDRASKRLTYETDRLNPSFVAANLSRTTRWARENKVRVISHYSNGMNQCNHCGFSDMRALSIDHINGGGGKHRKGLGNFYRWLIKNNLPIGYQVLCMNCQFIKIRERGENRWEKIT